VPLPRPDKPGPQLAWDASGGPSRYWRPATSWYTRPGARTRGPRAGLLQGVYTHIGVARFWDAQRRIETEPDGTSVPR
jgi:HEXXH motif-containing protein